ncbi:hypothetical protein EXU57_10090 [Segetibacter sp. 3557_3]|uniref:hypothetical protein n=1 Tax=Segetibacter sp. 3557_3 TaxID=2547429 RepID=UPI001058E37F|nr:hypothetical protein [Segetibacter sp. 3557_3]TDH26437.1 hypothetical protein EXU57_10090 [Segetibacter sp. 3557_3]
MSQQHNPIANLITKIQQHWIKEVSSDPNSRIVQWLIDPGEVKLYHAFLQLESTRAGELPEMIVAQITPFQSADTFSAAIAATWMDAYVRDTTLAKTGNDCGNFRLPNSPEYHLQPFRREQDLLYLLKAFRQNFLPGRKLTLALLPDHISSLNAYEQWMHLVKKSCITDGITFVAFVPRNTRNADGFPDDSPSVIKTISLSLDLEGSINKIATSGDPLNPEVHLRNHLFKMSKAVQNNSLTGLRTAGASCLSYQLRFGNMALIATAHIIFAGMLFNFKTYQDIESTLQKGLRFAKRGMQLGDQSCKPLIVQCYGHLAACNQLNNNRQDAILNYQQQASFASNCGLHLQAITAWQQAATLAKDHDHLLHLQLLEEAWDFSKQMPVAELSHSDFYAIGLALFDRMQEQKQYAAADEVGNRMTEVYGPGWEAKTRQKAEGAKSKKAQVVEYEHTAFHPV